MDLYIHDYAGHVGQLEVARALAERGHRVVFSYCDLLGTPRADFNAGRQQPNLTVEPISIGQTINKKNYLKRQWQDVLYARALLKHYRQRRCDVAISANNPLIPQRSLLRHCRLRNTPLVHWWTDVYALAVKHGVGQKYGPVGPAVARSYVSLETRLLNQSDAVIAIAPQFQEVADQWNVTTQLTVIPVAAPTEQILPAAKSNPWSQRQGVETTTNVLYCGTLGNKHNPHLLLDLAASLVDRPEARVIVASEGVGADWLRERQTQLQLPNLMLLPFQDFDDYQFVLASADVHVSILNRDAAAYALPSKVMSQMCAARPQIAAAPQRNYAANLLREAEAGVVCSPDDVDGFCRTVTELLGDVEKRLQLGENGRRYVEQSLSLAVLVPRYEELLSRLAESRPSN